MYALSTQQCFGCVSCHSVILFVLSDIRNISYVISLPLQLIKLKSTFLLRIPQENDQTVYPCTLYKVLLHSHHYLCCQVQMIHTRDDVFSLYFNSLTVFLTYIINTISRRGPFQPISAIHSLIIKLFIYRGFKYSSVWLNKEKILLSRQDNRYQIELSSFRFECFFFDQC